MEKNYIWQENGETVFALYTMNAYLNGNKNLATLSYNEVNDLWYLESDYHGFNTMFLNEDGRDIKTLALEFIISQCDKECVFYQKIKSNLLS